MFLKLYVAIAVAIAFGFSSFAPAHEGGGQELTRAEKNVSGES